MCKVSAHLGKWLVLELKHVRLPHGEGAVVELHEELFCHVIGVVRRLRNLYQDKISLCTISQSFQNKITLTRCITYKKSPFSC